MSKEFWMVKMAGVFVLCMSVVVLSLPLVLSADPFLLQKAVHDETGGIICPDGGECPSGDTCCLNGGGMYGCCPLPNAVCCSDMKHCCPEGFTCSESSCVQ